MVYLKSEPDIHGIRESARLVSRTLAEVAKSVRPGVKTGELDRIAEDFIRKHDGVPAFKGYGPSRNPFPATLCVSVNDTVVHGIPGAYELEDGDIVSIDCGVNLRGYFGDAAYTFAVGDVDDATKRLLTTTCESLYKGIAAAVHGNSVGDIGQAVQEHCEASGFGVVRDLTGHGVGRNLHEEPSVPNFGKSGSGARLRSGMTLAIEPMITMGSWKVSFMNDGWTVKTSDGSMAAHYEHDILVREGAAEILSTFGYIEEITKTPIDLVGAHG